MVSSSRRGFVREENELNFGHVHFQVLVGSPSRATVVHWMCDSGLLFSPSHLKTKLRVIFAEEGNRRRVCECHHPGIVQHRVLNLDTVYILEGTVFVVRTLCIVG